MVGPGLAKDASGSGARCRRRAVVRKKQRRDLVPGVFLPAASLCCRDAGWWRDFFPGSYSHGKSACANGPILIGGLLSWTQADWHGLFAKIEINPAHENTASGRCQIPVASGRRNHLFKIDQMLLNQTQVVWILAFRFLSALNQRWRALPSDALYIPHGVRSLSRRDPLPNVAIAAMPDGLPLQCFDKASGIAERMEKTGLSEACVAAYLDTAGIAERVLT